MFIAIKTDDGRIKGKISFYCKVLHVSRQAFNKFLKTKDTPWKYQALADAMLDICSEDECNGTYGRIRMYQALQLKQPEGVHIPGERTVYRVMAEIGLNHKPKRKPNAITKADREASKSDDLIKRDFAAEKPLEKCMTDMTEIKASDGKLYVSAIFDCYDLAVLGLAMDTNMRATLFCFITDSVMSKAKRAFGFLCRPQPKSCKKPCGKSGSVPTIRRTFSCTTTEARRSVPLRKCGGPALPSAGSYLKQSRPQPRKRPRPEPRKTNWRCDNGTVYRGRRKFDLYVSQERPAQDGGQYPGRPARHGRGHGGAGPPDRRQAGRHERRRL